MRKSPLGKFHWSFVTENDPKVGKRKVGILIPVKPEGYAELTSDAAKQKDYAKKAKEFYDGYLKELETEAKRAYGANFKKSSNWERITIYEAGGQEYYYFIAKSDFDPKMADRTGKPIAKEDMQEKVANGNWGVIYSDGKVYASTRQNTIANERLNGVQYFCDGEAVAGGGGEVEFEALPELEIQDGDFDDLE